MSNNSLRILQCGVRSSIDALTSDSYTKLNNAGNIQAQTNITTHQMFKRGLLAGSIVAQKGTDLIGPAISDTDAVVGVLVNDVLGNPYESMSGEGSHRGVYVFGVGMYETCIYESTDTAGNDILGSYNIGDFLYASQNGLLTVEAGLVGGAAQPVKSIIVGVLLKVPTINDPWLRFNMRI